MKPGRLPSLKDLIAWYKAVGLEPVVNIDYAAKRVTIHPKAANDLETVDTLPSDIERAFGGS